MNRILILERCHRIYDHIGGSPLPLALMTTQIVWISCQFSFCGNGLVTNRGVNLASGDTDRLKNLTKGPTPDRLLTVHLLQADTQPGTATYSVNFLVERHACTCPLVTTVLDTELIGAALTQSN